MTRVSLVRLVANLIKESGSGTVMTVLPQCPGFTRGQVKNAFANAVQVGLIHMSERTERGAERGAMLGVYVPGPTPTEEEEDKPIPTLRHHRGIIPKVSSVWELGAMASQQL